MRSKRKLPSREFQPLAHAVQRIDDKPRGIAPPSSPSLNRLSPDSTAFDSAGYLATVFILLGGALDLHLRLPLPGADESQRVLGLPLKTGTIGKRNPRTSTPGPDVAERRARQRGIERARAEHDELRKLDWLTPQASSAIRAEATALDSPIGHGDTKLLRLALENSHVLPLRDHGEPEGGSRLALAIRAMALIERQWFAAEAIAHHATKTAPYRFNCHVVAPPNGYVAHLRNPLKGFRREYQRSSPDSVAFGSLNRDFVWCRDSSTDGQSPCHVSWDQRQ